MDTKTFLTRVSAPTDELVVALWKPEASKPRGTFWNRGSFKDYDDAVAAIQLWDRDPEWTVYFTVGRMANHRYTKASGSPGYHRRQQDATMFKAICFDLDIGDKYKTQGEGNKAVAGAIRAIGLPDPMVVSSGRGVHYYWPLITAIDKKLWEETSIALRLALEEHNVQIDTSKIHDASMVLRPVGTHWKKEQPWRMVRCVADCPDYDIDPLRQSLSKWIGQAIQKKATKKPMSALAASILRNCNLNIRRIGAKCNQVGAMLASGGEFDAMGNLVNELMWRGALGLAAYATDQEEAMLLLCSKHPEFDHDANMQKMANWNAAPTTCAYFKQHCAGGCVNCIYDGIVSPVSLNEEVPKLPPDIAATAEVAAAQETPEFNLPDDYYLSDGHVYMDVEIEVKDKDADGKTIIKIVKQRRLVCPYEIHVLGIYADIGFDASTARLAINHGKHDGWKVHDVPIPVIMQGGRDFVTFLGNKQLFIANETTVNSTRTFLVRYLDQVRQMVASGRDFTRFGWHDNMFLCGSELIGDNASSANRVMGSARMYTDKIRKVGSRETWADLTKFCDLPGAEHLGVGLLAACVGLFKNTSGLSTIIYNFYSPESGTGKTLALMLGSSTYMDPWDKYMLHPVDTDNSLYGTLGILGDLSAAIDELTTIDDEKRATDMSYRLSQGTDKGRMDSNAELKERTTWGAPTRASSNKSLLGMYDAYLPNSEAARMRTLEFVVDSRDFVKLHGEDLANSLKANYGWAIPEMARAIIDYGGPDVVWHRGVAAFDKTFKYKFESQERFWRAACIGCYAAGKVGQALGLFRFDVDRVIHYMIARCAELRAAGVLYRKDALDDIGQFLQEANHLLIVQREEFGSKSPRVQFPVPDNAVIRMDVIYDQSNPALPGSELIINAAAIRGWAKRNRDSYTRIVADLKKMGVLIDDHRRVTMYKGCQKLNPGQAHCIVLDLSHPRLAVALNGGRPVPVTSPSVAVLQPQAANAVP